MAQRVDCLTGHHAGKSRNDEPKDNGKDNSGNDWNHVLVLFGAARGDNGVRLDGGGDAGDVGGRSADGRGADGRVHAQKIVINRGHCNGVRKSVSNE